MRLPKTGLRLPASVINDTRPIRLDLVESLFGHIDFIGDIGNIVEIGLVEDLVEGPFTTEGYY